MLEIIKKAFANEKINFNELSSKIYAELYDLYEKKKEFVNDCKNAHRFEKLTKDNFVFSAEYKIRTLSEILSHLKAEDFSKDYKEEINSIRNKFAHAELMKDQNGRQYFRHGESGLTFDENLCKQIRINIIKHRVNFQKLIEML